MKRLAVGDHVRDIGLPTPKCPYGVVIAVPSRRRKNTGVNIEVRFYDGSLGSIAPDNLILVPKKGRGA